MSRPTIAVTMGDPAGIGPEICVRLLAEKAVVEQCRPIIFGDWSVVRGVADKCGLVEPKCVFSLDQWPLRMEESTEPAVLDFGQLDVSQVVPGEVSAATGRASYEYIDAAISAALRGQVDAVTTGPIHKEAFHAAGIRYPGHTEMFTEKTQARRSCMMLTSAELTCSLVTAHVGFRDVIRLLSIERIRDVIDLTHDALQRLRGRRPRLLVCGLNPHAGEHGLFGNEEERLIVPAIEASRSDGMDITGPLPPDTAFLPDRRREMDGFICMYHDQGLIPLKALAFDDAVNVTLGLPIIRTSVDHGTALDIAWKGQANVVSLIEAVKLATQLAGSKERQETFNTGS